jgi:hypothetical protein
MKGYKFKIEGLGEAFVPVAGFKNISIPEVSLEEPVDYVMKSFPVTISEIDATWNSEDKGFQAWLREVPSVDEYAPSPWGFFDVNGGYWEGYPYNFISEMGIIDIAGKWYPPSKLRRPLKAEIRDRERSEASWEVGPDETPRGSYYLDFGDDDDS